MPEIKNFNGFSEETLVFLKQLSANNNKLWFEAHKKEYETFVLQPLKNLVLDISGTMIAIDPFFETRPMINKTISGVYRDIRFSKDKSPYKTSFWITFKRPIKEWKDAPAYFFEISPENYRYGMGFYSATPQTMSLFRAAVDERLSDFEQVIAFYAKQKTFTLEGEKYKKTANDLLPESILEWYRRKNFYLVCNRPADTLLFTPKLTDELQTGFKMLAGLYGFLINVKQNG